MSIQIGWLQEFNMKNIVIILFVVVLLFEVVMTIKQKRDKKAIEDALTKSIVNTDYDTFYKMIESKEAIKSIPLYNRQFLKLNVALMQKEDRKINEVIQSFKEMRMNDSQIIEVSLKAFDYYIEKGNKKEARYYKKLILDHSQNDRIKELTKRTYSIYIDKSDEYLDVLLKENDALNGAQRAPNDLLLSKIYENKSDKALAQKYMQQYYSDTK